ncbi:MAG: heavy-metal-associated domain-containing protein [Peptococcaceae bacterium]|nr:heavy-metal-associated domain-containing protein [Peptococcaceae bacterium]
MSRALSNLPGVNAVTVDLMKRKVSVSYDPDKVSPDNLKGAITAAGYDIGA